MRDDGCLFSAHRKELFHNTDFLSFLHDKMAV